MVKKNILVFCDSIFEQNNEKKATGLSRMAYQVSKLISSNNNVYCCMNRFIKRKYEDDGIVYLKHTFFSTLFAFNIFYFFSYLKKILFIKKNFKYFIKQIYFAFNMCFIIHVIEKYNIDCVHLHAASPTTFMLASFCSKHGIPFAVTLHGVINKDEIYVKKSYKLLEAKIVNVVKESKLSKISTVSTGTMDFICNKYSVPKDKISVIYNPCSIANIEEQPDNYEWYINHKYILCVGSITQIRNQISLIEGFNRVKDAFNDLYLVLIGRNLDVIDENDYVANKHIIFLGQKSKGETQYIQRHATLSVNPAVCEGFGLPILESYFYHVPCLISNKIDSFIDFYDEKISYALNAQTPDEIERMLITIFTSQNLKYDENAFNNIVQKFSVSNISHLYNSLFESLSQKNKKEIT